jgi:dynactin-6
MFITQPTIKGPLQLGDGNIVMTRVSFINEHESGEIIIGKSNLFEDRVTIINKTPGKMIIGNNNQFHSGCIISAQSIGNDNEFGAFCSVEEGVVIRDYCNVGIKVLVKVNAILENQTFQFADTRSRISSIKPSIHEKHLEYLYETLPKYHSVN